MAHILVRYIILLLFVTIYFSLQTVAASAAVNRKSNVVILATGGTIAGKAETEQETTQYQAGIIGIDALIESVPEVKEIANVSGEQICNIDSKDITDEIWLKLAKRINELFANGSADGVVITHGTDTLEETAYFLNLTIKYNNPVVLVGAMRPSTAISADGPMNLLNAVRVATNPKSINKGILVVMNDEIHSAREVTKTNTLNVNTFKSPEFGSLGYVNAGIPEFYRNPTRIHTSNSEFDVDNLLSLPCVKIIYGHANDDEIFVEAAINAKIKGIIYAGTGNGSINQKVEKALAKAVANGIVVVRSSHVGSGAVVSAEKSYTDNKFLNGDTLKPQKARILLQLALTKTSDLKVIQNMFEIY